jgi:hypothetical protein
LLHHDGGIDSERQKENIMRQVVVTEFLSLDGVMEEPAWSAPYWNNDIAIDQCHRENLAMAPPGKTRKD